MIFIILLFFFLKSKKMNFFRSAKMTHQKIRIPKEIANETLRALGNLEDGVEFVDLTQDDIEAKKKL